MTKLILRREKQQQQGGEKREKKEAGKQRAREDESAILSNRFEEKLPTTPATIVRAAQRKSDESNDDENFCSNFAKRTDLFCEQTICAKDGDVSLKDQNAKSDDEEDAAMGNHNNDVNSDNYFHSFIATRSESKESSPCSNENNDGAEEDAPDEEEESDNDEDDYYCSSDSVSQRIGSKEDQSRNPGRARGGYWSDFSNLEKELRSAIAEMGDRIAPGRMPSSRQLRGEGLRILERAIQKHGGFPRVAERLGLVPSYCLKKPQGYWDDFNNVKSELNALIEKMGDQIEPGRMPLRRDLRREGLGKLEKAIEKHGGLLRVAERLGLVPSCSMVKSRGYWDDFNNVKSELNALIEKMGDQIEPGRMPSGTEIQREGFRGLVGGICRHGGFPVVAERLGLVTASSAATAAKRQRVGEASTQEKEAINSSSGSQCNSNSRESGKSKSDNQEAAAMGNHNNDINNDSSSSNYFHSFVATRSDIYQSNSNEDDGDAISVESFEDAPDGEEESDNDEDDYYCSSDSVSQRMSSKEDQSRNPGRARGGYWSVFSNLEKELRSAIAEMGDRIAPGRMPLRRDLRQEGLHKLEKAIQKHGGLLRVAERLGLVPSCSMVKSRGYWDDFNNVKSELNALIEKMGDQIAPGTMPSSSVLQQEGFHGLDKAIQKQGGFAIVAERLGLVTAYGERNPTGYWGDFNNVKSELNALIEKMGDQIEPGRMPSSTEILREGLRGLVGGIRRHGGFVVVAERLGLVTASSAATAAKRQRVGEASTNSDFANLKQVSIAFRLRDNTQKQMITVKMSNAVALQENISPLDPKAEESDDIEALHDFSMFEKHLRLFLATMGDRIEPGRMPLHRELINEGYGHLSRAIVRHGGSEKVAERLGLHHSSTVITSKPRGYLNDFANLDKEIRLCIEQMGDQIEAGRMPTQQELIREGCSNLCAAITQHGGFPRVAERMGLTALSKPTGYWNDFKNVQTELQAFLEKMGDKIEPGRMPTQQELVREGCSSLNAAIRLHGGFTTISERLGLAPLSKPIGYWANFDNVRVELDAFIEKMGDKIETGRMPTQQQLVSAGYSTLSNAISLHGGFPLVAERLGRFRKSTLTR